MNINNKNRMHQRVCTHIILKNPYKFKITLDSVDYDCCVAVFIKHKWGKYRLFIITGKINGYDMILQYIPEQVIDFMVDKLKTYYGIKKLDIAEFPVI